MNQPHRNHGRGAGGRVCTRRGLGAAFSLVEVILAVGIFAFAVTVVLALLPALARHATSSRDTLAALSLPDPVRTELLRLATAGGFDALAGQTTVLANPSPATLVLVASRDATRIQSLTYLPPTTTALAGDEQFFLIEVWKFGPGASVYDPAGAWLALHVRVAWPLQVPGAGVDPPAVARDQISFNLALNR